MQHSSVQHSRSQCAGADSSSSETRPCHTLAPFCHTHCPSQIPTPSLPFTTPVTRSVRHCSFMRSLHIHRQKHIGVTSHWLINHFAAIGTAVRVDGEHTATCTPLTFHRSLCTVFFTSHTSYHCCKRHKQHTCITAGSAVRHAFCYVYRCRVSLRTQQAHCRQQSLLMLHVAADPLLLPLSHERFAVFAIVGSSILLMYRTSGLQLQLCVVTVVTDIRSWLSLCCCVLFYCCC